MQKRDEWFDLLAYLSVCAKEMYIGPQIYAPLRLLTVMQRLLALLADEQMSAADSAFLAELQQELAENRSLLLQDRAAFGAYLDRLVEKIAVHNFA